MGPADFSQGRSPDDLVASLPVQHMMIMHLALKENSSNGRNHMVLEFLFTSVPSGLATPASVDYFKAPRKTVTNIRYYNSQLELR